MRIIGLIIFISTLSLQAYAEWKFDFSRRNKDIKEMEKQSDINKKENRSFLDMVFEKQAPTQEIVLLHTANGFMPQHLQVKKNQRYKVMVVNVDKQSKNVSFMFDAFSEHHGTYFAEPVTFLIEPRKEGMYQFSCPETAAKGQLIVTGLKNPIDNPMERVEIRKPASR